MLDTHYPCSRAVDTAREHDLCEHGCHFGHPCYLRRSV